MLAWPSVGASRTRGPGDGLKKSPRTPLFQRGDVYTLENMILQIHDIDLEGRGRAVFDGWTYAVRGAFPGDEVQINVMYL